MSSPLRVKEALAARGMADRVRRFDATTRTSADAAEAIGCTVAQIAKTMVFKAGDGRAVLVVASGANRVDEKAVAALVGQKIARADADFVREATGFAIGGVSPLGFDGPPPAAILIDTDLTALGDLWAAAGDPHSVFRLGIDELLTITGGTIAPVAKR